MAHSRPPPHRSPGRATAPEKADALSAREIGGWSAAATPRSRYAATAIIGDVARWPHALANVCGELSPHDPPEAVVAPGQTVLSWNAEAPRPIPAGESSQWNSASVSTSVA
jgi:hypothetical protein